MSAYTSAVTWPFLKPDEALRNLANSGDCAPPSESTSAPTSARSRLLRAALAFLAASFSAATDDSSAAASAAAWYSGYVEG